MTYGYALVASELEEVTVCFPLMIFWQVSVYSFSKCMRDKRNLTLESSCDN